MIGPRILLLGNTGQVGWELNRTLLTLGELNAIDYPEIDMSDEENIRKVVRQAQPNLIVNATAYTNVDQAESEQDLAMAINGYGPGILAEEATKLGAALIHFSTDFVFDGTKETPYLELDQPNPISAYGRTKYIGEKSVQSVDCMYLILRTSWVYSMRRPCFVTKVLKWAETKKELRIVDDQVSSPSWARMLAEATAQIIAQGRDNPIEYIKGKKGIYHLAGAKSCSRFEWAQAIIKFYGIQEKVRIEPAKSDEFETAAKRPSYSFLDTSKVKKNFHIYPMEDLIFA